MFKRDWRAAIAIGLTLLWVAPTLSQQSKQPVLKGDPVPNAGQQQRAQDRQQAAPNKEQRSPDLLSVIEGIERAIREHVTKEDQEESKRKEKREVADLEAQQEQAFWAKAMFWAAFAALFLTFAGLALTSIGVGLLYYTLGHTRDAAKAAQESVVLAQRAAKAAEDTNALVASNAAREVRAFLSVIPAGINELIRGNGSGHRRVMGHVDVRNVGKLPARNVWVRVKMRIDGRDDIDGSETKRGVVSEVFRPPEDPMDTDPEFGVDRAILPGTEMRQGAANDDILYMDDLVKASNLYVYVWGVVYYDDGYRRRFTKFRHRYAIASRDRRLDGESEAFETRAIITVDKARYHPFGNSAD